MCGRDWSSDVCSSDLERVSREVGKALHPLGPTGRASEGPGTRPLSQEGRGVVPAVGDLDVAFRDTRHVDRLFAARDPAEALVESTPDLILAEQPDEQRGHPAPGKLSHRFADKRPAQTLALMRGQD